MPFQMIANLSEICPDLASEWNIEKNGDKTPDMFGKASKEKVWWTCSKCGYEYPARINSRVYRGSGCPVCANQAVLAGYNDLVTLCPDVASQWDYGRNGELRPEMFTKGSEKLVWWNCECGNHWQAMIKSRTAGEGCPKCAAKKQTSFPEQAILYYLKQLPFGAISRCKPNWFVTDDKKSKLELDVYIPTLGIGIEYDGSTYHADPERDSAKNALCNKLGIELIRVREPGCPSTDKHGCVEICLEDKKSEALENAITSIIENIEKASRQYLTVDVNLSRDRAAIYCQMDSSVKKNSLSLVNPDLSKCWDFDKNGALTPDNVTAGMHRMAWFVCSECGESHETLIANASRKPTYMCRSCACKKAYAS